jgi:VWFA-related protein
MDLIKDAGVTVYSIELRWPYEPPTSLFARSSGFVSPQFVMRRLADETGGRYFTATQASELSQIYTAIATELAHQYTLGYVSRNPRRDGAYRHVVVRIVDRPQCTARTRSGYRAPNTDPPTR